MNMLMAQTVGGVSEAAEAAVDSGFKVEGAGVIIEADIGGFIFRLTTSITVQWVVVALLGLLFFVLGRNLKVKPTSKKQMLAEALVGFFTKTVNDSMGEKYHRYAPYIATLLLLSMCSNLAGLLGMRAPTSDISVIAAWGVITFILVQRNKFKTGGIKGAAKSLIEPVVPLLPINIMGCFTDPLSQTFRHFGNIMAGGIIMGIVYWAMGNFAVFIPAVLSLYFDLFGAVIQAFVFSTLTMTYILMADCSPD